MESLSKPDYFLPDSLEPRPSTELATSEADTKEESPLGLGSHAASSSSRKSAIPPSIKEEDGEKMEEFQEDLKTAVIWIKVFSAGAIFLLAMVVFPLSWTIPGIIAILISAIIPRILYLKRARYTRGRDWIKVATYDSARADLRCLPAVYLFFVLGSGGHTSEMMDIIQRTCRCSKNIHRRYLYTAGDNNSKFAIRRLECQITNAYSAVDRGTWDQFEVPRARRVHQSWWTTPISCIDSAWYGVMALTRQPEKRPITRHGDQYCIPHVVVTNGPGTGFVMAVIAYMLKLLCLVPETRLKVVYIETWAHVTTLSLTGKLFHWTKLADLFVVQHKQLAEKYGHLFVGDLVGNWSGRWWDDESADVGGTRGQGTQ